MKSKFIITSTIADTLFFFKGQSKLWKESFEICAISSNKEKLILFAKEEGVSYKYMHMHRNISIVNDILCLFRFIWLFIIERPYIVHGNTPKASMLSMVAAWMTHRPVRIYMCHGLRYQTTDGSLRHLLMFMEKLSCKCATNVICVSEGVKNQLIKDHLCHAAKAKVIRYGTAGGVNVNHFSRESINNEINTREKLSIPEASFVFCFVGRIVKDKGINELVNAFDKLSKEKKNVHLLLVGPEENDLDPISTQTKIIIESNERILALGKQNDVRPYLAASNAFVLPSYREGVGMVILEANAMGIPAIASNIIGCKDVIEPGINGELIPSHNEYSLYEKMKNWEENQQKVEKMAQNCREYVCSRYSSDDVASAYYKYYIELTEANNS